MSIGLNQRSPHQLPTSSGILKSPPLKPRKIELFEFAPTASTNGSSPQGPKEPFSPLKGSFGVLPPVPAEHYLKRAKAISRYNQRTASQSSPGQQHASVSSPPSVGRGTPSGERLLSPPMPTVTLSEMFRDEDAQFAKYMTRAHSRTSKMISSLSSDGRKKNEGSSQVDSTIQNGPALSHASSRARTVSSSRRPSSLFTSYIRPSFLEGLRDPPGSPFSPTDSNTYSPNEGSGSGNNSESNPPRLRLSLVNDNFRISDEDDMLRMERQKSDSVDNLLIPSHRSTAETCSNQLSHRSSEATSTLSTARVGDRAAGWNILANSENFRARALLRQPKMQSSMIDKEASLREWNTEYQELLEQHTQGPADAEAKARKMEALLESFRDTVTPIIETIVAERHSPIKTVPLQPLGGIAGGDKYVVGNIVVKFAVTDRTLRMYGSHENAVKSVGHELRGLNAIISTELSILHVPLVMTVSYLGHVVWVASKLPIDETTLKHGSRDGGKTVVSNDDQARDIANKLGKVLNLKEHVAGTSGTELCGPADLEVHLARDGRFYAIDTARMFPPDCNQAIGHAPNFFLYRSLRQELVQSLPMPLSSDAFSAFGRHHQTEHNEEVRRASTFITNQLIPNLCRDVPQLFRMASVREPFNVAAVFHDCGVNLRYLALVLQQYTEASRHSGQAPSQAFVTHCVVEIISRSFRSVVNEQLFHATAEDDRRQIVLDRFNDLLLPNKAFWKEHLIPCALRKFPCSQMDETAFVPQLISNCMRRTLMENVWVSVAWTHNLIFQRSSQLVGAEWDVDAVRDKSLVAKFGADESSSRTVVLVAPLLLGLVPVVRLCALSPFAAVHRLVESGDLGGAEEIYLNELNVRSIAVGETAELANLLVNIVSLYLMSNWGPGRPRVADAVKAAKRLVLIYQKIVVRDEDESSGTSFDQDTAKIEPSAVFGYVSSLMRLAEVLRDQGEVQESVDVISTAIKAYSQYSMQNKMLLCQLHCCAGKSWQRIGQYTLSFESFEASVTVARAIVQVDSSQAAVIQLASVLQLQAEVAHDLGMSKSALVTSGEAAGIALSGNLPRVELALAHVTYAMVRWDGVQFAGNETDITNVSLALPLLRSTFSPKSPQVARGLLVMSQLMREKGKHSEGIRMCEEALSIVQYCCGSPSLAEAAALTHLSTFYFLPCVESPPHSSENGNDNLEKVSGSRRFGVALSFLRQAENILAKLRADDTPTCAKVLAMLADVTRVAASSSHATPREISDAIKLASSAVQIYESLLMFNCRDYIYAVNVKALLRYIQQPNQPPTSSIGLLFQVLSSSDRFMLVANSDFFTLENIVLLQSKCAANTIASRAKILVSRDGHLRKLSGMLLASFMHLAMHEVLETAMIVKQIIVLFRILFAPNDAWNSECAPFLPKLQVIGINLLDETGRAAGPVTELAERLLKIREEEGTKQRNFEENQRRHSFSKEVEDRLHERRSLEHRLLSQIKQVSSYFLLRNMKNGFSLLNAALHFFADLFPNGADADSPNSILAHNSIVHELHFARSEIRGHNRSTRFDGELAEAEQHAEDALRITQPIEADFMGLPPRGLAPRAAYKAEF